MPDIDKPLLPQKTAFSEDLDRIRFAMNAAGIGVWEVDLTNNNLVWDNRCGALFGITKSSELPYNQVIQYIHPDDVNRVTESVKAALNGEDGGQYDATYRTLGAEDGKLRWVNATGSAYFDHAGKMTRFGGVMRDVTEQHVAQKQVSEGEYFRKRLSDSVPAMIFHMDAEQRYTSYNETFMQWFGVNETEAIGKTTREFIGDAAYNRIKPHLDKAYSGQKVNFQMPAPTRLSPNRWLDITYTPFKSEDGCLAGVIVHATDITQIKLSEIAIKESEQRFRSLIEEAPIATCLFVGKDMVIEVANQRMIEVWGKGNNVLGKPLAQALPELKGQHFLPLLDKLFVTGEIYESKGGRADLVVDGELRTYYFNYTFKPLRNDSGEVYAILEVADDVTEQVTARQRIKAAEEKLRLAIESANLGAFEVDLTTNEIETSGRFNAIWGIEHPLQRKELVSYIHPDDLEIRQKAHQKSLQTGQLSYEARIVRPDQSTVWIQALGTVLFDENRKPTTLTGVVQDITAHKEFSAALQRQVKERTRELEAAQDSIMRNATYLQGILDNLNNAVVSLVPVYKKGELVDFTFKMVNGAYSQYSGLPASSTQGRWVSEVFPGYYNTEAFANYRHTFETGEPSRWDIHYNEDNLNVYLNVVTAKVEGEVIVQIMNVTDLKTLQASLEQKISELERSNTNLEEFAHAASHDLKEPMRKAHTFTNLLKQKIDGRLTAEEWKLFHRLEYANERMRLLVEDLLQYSRLSYMPYAKEPIDLNRKVALVMEDLELVIQEAQAELFVEALPVVPGYRRQLQQLFQNLISNSIKFRRPGVPPKIWISAKEVLGATVLGETEPEATRSKTFYLIEVRDNGIGFEPQYAEQIFRMFQRLHGKSEYEGTGLGLAIASRVVANHNGHIWAESSLGDGATFKILLPVK